MRNIAIAAVLGFTAVLAACSDDTTANQGISSTLAGPVMAKSTSVACTNAQSQLVEDNAAAIFSDGAVLDSVEALWRKVKQDCSTSNSTRMSSAQDAFMEYVRYGLLLYRDNTGIIATDRSAALVAHWDIAFPFVSYPAPGLASNVLTVGSARVVSRSEMAANSVEFGIPGRAALKTAPQNTGGDPRGHLFVIYPETSDCLPNQSALEESSDCFNFKSFPKSSPNYNPGMTVGICYEDDFIAPGMGHDDGVKATVEPTFLYPSLAFCHDSAGVNSVRYGSNSILGRVTRLASKLFGTKRAYATHGGLGTIAPGFSTFGPVERNLFKATFSPLSVGATPAVGALTGGDKGYWTKVFSTSPGSITVEASSGNLIQQPVVLDQGGGACGSSCGGLDLHGQIQTDDASRAVSGGQYRVTWQSVQNQPSPKAAPIVLRSKDSLEIARVSYSKENGVAKIRYNGKVVDSVTWVVGQAQEFSILVDFTTKKTTLSITSNPFGIALTRTLPAEAFVKNPGNAVATNLSRIQAEFTNIDSGIVGWDNIFIEKLPDSGN
jgi:hypothetical protein